MTNNMQLLYKNFIGIAWEYHTVTSFYRYHMIDIQTLCLLKLETLFNGTQKLGIA